MIFVNLHVDNYLLCGRVIKIVKYLPAESNLPSFTDVNDVKLITSITFRVKIASNEEVKCHFMSLSTTVKASSPTERSSRFGLNYIEMYTIYIIILSRFNIKCIPNEY